MPTQWCLVQPSPAQQLNHAKNHNKGMTVGLWRSILDIQVSMHKMLRWEKKGPYDAMKFLLKNIENKIQDCFGVRSCNKHVELYTPTPVLLKTNYMYNT